ncbi:hypothetical protein VCRA2113O23_40074 [Vibrio crassostreae]|nr:hypothetical protein VCHA29O37_40083 [Vibrio chagasii]CAK2955075.1 hypothetical protein VCRA2113O23_40074 [Vibrio crassostreae]
MPHYHLDTNEALARSPTMRGDCGFTYVITLKDHFLESLPPRKQGG